MVFVNDIKITNNVVIPPVG